MPRQDKSAAALELVVAREAEAGRSGIYRLRDDERAGVGEGARKGAARPTIRR
jgi:hypothetical protein